MPSLDFIYDLKEKLDEENMEYVICVLRHGKKDSKIDMHMNLTSDESVDMVCETFEKVCSQEDFGNDEDIEIEDE
jgi:hypothetical protein